MKKLSARHLDALISLASDETRRKLDQAEARTDFESALRRLELRAHRNAEYFCNGRRPSGRQYRIDDWDAFTTRLRANVTALFGNKIPGLRVNGDARGHALKIDCQKGLVPDGMETDAGHYGILYPLK